MVAAEPGRAWAQGRMASGRPLEQHFASAFVMFLGHLPYLICFLQKILEITTFSGSGGVFCDKSIEII